MAPIAGRPLTRADVPAPGAPSCPSLLLPQQKTCVSMSAQLCADPAASSTAAASCVPFCASAGIGMVTSPPGPAPPTSPSALLPQHHTSPLVPTTAQVCASPAAAAVTGLIPRSAGTG